MALNCKTPEDVAKAIKEHDIRHVDLGGALAIPYRLDNEPPPLPDAYAAIVRRHIAPLGLKVMFEPGRLLVGNAGILVSDVIYMKHGDGKDFLIVDALVVKKKRNLTQQKKKNRTTDS